MDNLKQLFISQYESNYSRSSIHASSIRSDSLFLRLQLKDFVSPSKVRSIFKKIISSDVLCVMSPSHLLVIPLAVFTRERVILDAGWPLSDSTMTSSNFMGKSFRKVKNYLIDFFSFSFSSVVILESYNQANRVHRKFRTSENKTRVIYTGVDETRFEDLQEYQPSEANKANSESFIFFRGKYNREAGIELILNFFQNNSHLFLILAVPDIPENITVSSNVILINRMLSDAEIKWLYLNATSALGQFGETKRQDYSVPHKFYEAAYFGCPYVSPNKAVLNEPQLVSSFIACDNLNDFRVLIQSEHLKGAGLRSKDNYNLHLSNKILRRQFDSILSQNRSI